MLPLGDILHRGLVLTCASVSAYGLFVGYAVHRDTLRRGEGMRICCLLKILLT
jgi:hypothetical protein